MTKRMARIGILLVLAIFGVQISAAQGNTPPSGEIAFTSDRNGTDQIYLMNADGSNVRQLSHDKLASFAPIWSPDGQKLLYSHVVGTQVALMVMDADGSHSVQIAPEQVPADAPLDYVWSPDSQWIIYPALVVSGTTTNIRFYRVKADGTEDQLLDFGALYTGKNSIQRVSFFPDGKHLLVTALDSLYITDLDGSHALLLTAQLGNPAALSPNGQQIVGAQAAMIVKTDSQGSEPQTLFPGLTDPSRSDFHVGSIDWLDWSPDGRYIWGVVTTYPDNVTQLPEAEVEQDSEVFIGTARGDDYWLHEPTPEDGHISWSPDSQWFAYRYEADNYMNQIAISQPIGTNVMTITSGSDNSQPAWRPVPRN